MIPFDSEMEVKHGLKQVGKKFVFSINGVDPEDAGLYQVEVDGVKVFSTDFKRKMMHQINYRYTTVTCAQCHLAGQKQLHLSCPVAGSTRYYVKL